MTSPAPSSPAGAYPRHWEADVVLRDGSTMSIRPILPSDAEALQRFHMAQSPESTYLRFFASMARLSPADLTRFTTVDHDDRVALVLVAHDEIVAVGRYDRIDADDAEVAFNVSDRVQGRGVGSVLLEHLAAAGRERGVRRFLADVLPVNTRMIRVFTDAGYDVTKRFEDGIVTVSFTIHPTDRSMEVMAERERRAESLSMRRILAATSVLVYGAGDEGTALADRVWGHVAAAAELPGGFRGRRTYAKTPQDLNGLEGPFDLAVLGAGATGIIDLVPRLAELDVGAALVLSGGFATDGAQDDGPSQRTLLRALRQAGIRLVGPRSVGVLARGSQGGLPALLNPGEGDFRAGQFIGDEPAVGIFCQSAMATRALLVGSARRRLRLSTLLSAGHRADVSGNDTMLFWTADELTSVACVHLESIGNPRKFSRVARRLAQDRPVIVRVAGRTGQVRPPGHPVRTTRTPRRALEELMDQAGVLLADSVEQQLDWAMMFYSQPLPAGGRVAILTNSGTQTAILGELFASIGADAVAEVPTLNPVATTTEYQRVLDSLCERDDWDAAFIGYGPFLDDEAAGVAPAIAEFAHRTGRLVLAQVHGITGLHPTLEHAGTQVPGFATGEDAVEAFRAARAYAHRKVAPTSPRVDPPGIDRRRAIALIRSQMDELPTAGTARLSNPEAAELLAAYGLAILPSRIVKTEDEAVAAAAELGWPIVLKVADDALRHRTDLGGVRLDVSSPSELRHAMATMRSRFETARGSGTAIPAFEVQAMAETGAACVVTAEEDPLYGPIVSLGLGGDAVELLGDISYRVPPLTGADVTSLITSLKAAPRLLGHRDLPPLDIPALEDVVGRVSVLKEELAEVARLEINPVLVTRAGTVILSAVVDIARPGRGDTARRVLPQ